MIEKCKKLFRKLNGSEKPKLELKYYKGDLKNTVIIKGNPDLYGNSCIAYLVNEDRFNEFQKSK